MSVSIVLAGHGSGHPSTKGMNSYCKSRQAAGKGLVEVIRPDITDTQRAMAHNSYEIIIGRNIYNQLRRLYCYVPYSDGAYYSDCSSSICKTLERAGLTGVGSLNTAGMHNSKKFQKVDVIIENGIIQNPEVLKVTDCLMFKGSDPTRPLGIGHVEMVYEISGTTDNSTVTPAKVDTTTSIVANGQKAANNFVDAGLVIDGIRGKLTKKAGVAVLQKALNLDYKLSLAIDGALGSKTKAPMKTVSKARGSKGYIVTATEILLSLKGYDPNGIEYPGQFGAGLAKAISAYQSDNNLEKICKINYDLLYSLTQ